MQKKSSQLRNDLKTSEKILQISKFKKSTKETLENTFSNTKSKISFNSFLNKTSTLITLQSSNCLNGYKTLKNEKENRVLNDQFIKK